MPFTTNHIYITVECFRCLNSRCSRSKCVDEVSKTLQHSMLWKMIASTIRSTRFIVNRLKHAKTLVKSMYAKGTCCTNCVPSLKPLFICLSTHHRCCEGVSKNQLNYCENDLCQKLTHPKQCVMLGAMLC